MMILIIIVSTMKRDRKKTAEGNATGNQTLNKRDGILDATEKLFLITAAHWVTGFAKP